MSTDYFTRIKKMEEKGLRLDGRKFDEYRKIELIPDFSDKAEGSCHVKIGETEVLVGVKVGLGKPYPDTADKGNLIVNAEITPMSGAEYEPGPPSEVEIALARVVDRGIRESGAIQTKNLCITPGERVYEVFIDAYVINDDGNLLDAAGIGALKALKIAKMPFYDKKEDKLDYKKEKKGSLPLEFEPIYVTIVRIDDMLLVDPTKVEMDEADAKITITLNEKDRVVSLQKEGSKGFKVDEIKECFKIATKHSKEMRKLVNKK